MSNIGDSVSSGITDAIDFFRDLPSRIVDTLGDLGKTLFGAGGDLMGGFIRGIKGAVRKVGDAIGGVMDFVGGFFPHSPAKRGPFSGSGWRAILTAGEAISAQFNTGLHRSMPDVGMALGSSVKFGSVMPRGEAFAYGSAVSASSAPIYVQNPFTGEYLLAQVSSVADGQIKAADAANSATTTGRRR